MRRAARRWRGARARKLAAWLLAASVLSAQSAGACADPVKDAGTEFVRIYADADWYKSRPEPERRWRGILREHPVVAGPGSRTALTFALVTTQATYPVYAAGVQKELAPFTGRSLEVEAKLVDLGDEGFGKELWIGRVRPVDAAGR